MTARPLRKLALKLLWRDWRGGELNILIAALLVAVTTVTSIGLFADRIQNSILNEASALLAADAQVVGSKPIPEAWQDWAQEAALKTSLATSFQAMAFGNDGRLQLAAVKAVDSAYPLKGALEVADEAFAVGVPVTDGPQPGTAWLNSRLMASLQLNVGDTVGVGDADLIVAKVLMKEPDSASSEFGFNPRVMIHADDIPATGAVQLGSRVRYSWMLQGDVDAFYQRWNPEQGDHHRWRNVDDANESISESLARSESFLLLAGSLGVVLAGVALALAAKRFASRQLSHVALLKTLGLTPNNIAWLYSGNLTLLGVVVTLISVALGWALHWAFLEVFAGLLPTDLAAPGWRPVWIGLLTGLICLLAFALPPVWMLRQTPPARVLRSDLDGGTLSQWRTLVLGFVATVVLVGVYSGSALITGALIVAALVAAGAIGLVARALISVLRKLLGNASTAWRLGLASLHRHSRGNSFQIMIFAVALMLLFILTLMRTSLLSEWQRQLPEGTPNHFAFNIFPDEKPGIESFLADNNIPSTPFYPMIRGRLTDIGDDTLQDRLSENRPDGDDYRRELNITWSQTLAEDNEVVDGEWFDGVDSELSLVSIEQDFAEALSIRVGDRLTFSFGGQAVEAQVASIRTVQWDSLTPNFYVIFDRPILDGQGAAFLTSFYLAPDEKSLLVSLLADHPTVSVIEVDQILDQVQRIVQQVTRAVEFILALVLVAGLIVLVASVQATLDTRLQESAILRTLGAKGRVVRGALALEFMSLGALAGILAAVGAQVALYFLQTELLNIQFTPSLLLLVTGPIVGAMLIGAVGITSTRRVTRVPPLLVLRTL